MRFPELLTPSLLVVAVAVAGCTSTVTVIDDGGGGSGASTTSTTSTGGSSTGGSSTGGSSTGGTSAGGSSTGGSGGQGGGPVANCTSICEDWLLCTMASNNCSAVTTNTEQAALDDFYFGCVDFCNSDPNGAQLLDDTMDQNLHHESVTDLRAVNPEYVMFCGSSGGQTSSNPNLFCGDLVFDMVFCLTVSDVCPGIHAQTPVSELWKLKAGTLEACDGPIGPALDNIVDPQDCDGTADTLRNLNMDIDQMCE